MIEDFSKRPVNGCNRAPLDSRDYKHVMGAKLTGLPVKVDRYQQCGEVLDQGATNACVGHAVVTMTSYQRMSQGKQYPLARRRIYYDARAAIGQTMIDSGCNVRDAVEALRTKGSQYGREGAWSYTPASPNDPPTTIYTAPTSVEISDGLQHKTPAYYFINPTVAEMKDVLQTTPFVVGMYIFQQIYGCNSSNPVIALPSVGESPVGSHAVTIIGYNDATQRFQVQNSWGKGWGLNGFSGIPYAYLTDPNLAWNHVYSLPTT